jgi:hypothetical protein
MTSVASKQRISNPPQSSDQRCKAVDGLPLSDRYKAHYKAVDESKGPQPSRRTAKRPVALASIIARCKANGWRAALVTGNRDIRGIVFEDGRTEQL